MPLQVGQVLGERYEILRVVTRGGMGAVYEARDRRLGGSACAVKEMLERFEGKDAAFIRDKFRVEMELLARLNHPGIPGIRDSFVLGPICYLVMDFIEGDNLDQELQGYLRDTGQPFPAPRLVKDVGQLLGILDYLHRLDPPVIHRDIKPANLIRERRTGRVCLVDFGLARTFSLGHHTAVGTLGYAPQEQLCGQAEPRSDLYAVGVMMRELLSGKAPDSLVLSSVRQLLPTLDPGLADIIDQATAFRSSDRFSTPRAMFEALRRWEGSPLPEPAADPSPAAPSSTSGAVRLLDLLIRLAQSSCLGLLTWKSRLEARPRPVSRCRRAPSRAVMVGMAVLTAVLGLVGWRSLAPERTPGTIAVAAARASAVSPSPEAASVPEAAPPPPSRPRPVEEVRLQPPEELQLMGTLETDSGLSAVLCRGGAYRTVRKGQSCGGYEVRSIKQGEVVLSRSGVTYLLKI